MFCHQCGTANDDRNRFCTACGASLQPAAPTPQDEARPNSEWLTVDNIDQSSASDGESEEI